MERDLEHAGMLKYIAANLAHYFYASLEELCPFNTFNRQSD